MRSFSLNHAARLNVDVTTERTSVGNTRGSAAQTARKSVRVEGTAIWYIAPCSFVEVHRRFGSEYCLHLQDGVRATPQIGTTL
jgi:hypothetical protein